MRRLCFVVVGALATFVGAHDSWAQGIGAASIVGVVRDVSGAVLPGVTVEAASPVLIEKVRTATTDGEGRHQIAELRPGAYTVTFTLPGFSTFKRDGLELSSFRRHCQRGTPRWNVGGDRRRLRETPLVDVRSVSKGTVVSQETLAVSADEQERGWFARARARRRVTCQRCRHGRDQRRTVRSDLCFWREARRHAPDDERDALQQLER